MIILKHCDIPINRESYLNIKQHYIHRWAHIFKIKPIEKSERQVSNRRVKSMSKNLRLWWTQMVCNFKVCHLSDTKCYIEMLNTFRMINRWKSTSYMFNRPITASNPELLPHNRPLLTCLQYYTTHSIPWVFPSNIILIPNGCFISNSLSSLWRRYSVFFFQLSDLLNRAKYSMLFI